MTVTVLERPVDVADLAFLSKRFEELRPGLLAYAARRVSPDLRSLIDPEAVVNEVQGRAHQRWDAFKKAHEPLGRADLPYADWLFGLARDHLRDLHRHHHAKKGDARRNVPFPDNSASQLLLGIISPGSTPSARFARAEQEERLAQVVALLKESDRTLLRLRYYENRPWEEVGAALGLTALNARQKHHRVIRRLKNLWKQLYGDEGLQP